MNDPFVKHILDTRQFKDREFLKAFYDRTDQMARAIRRGKVDRRHEGKIVASLFYESSTRTKLSFDAAAKRLGAEVIGTENAKEFSSAFKGETLEHSMMATEDLYDVVVLRHPENGAPARAASAIKKSVINAGDGTNQHPTQALLDLYTIRDIFGQIDNLRVGFVGDIAHGRTVKSLVYLLAHLNDHKLHFVAPKELGLPEEIAKYLRDKRVEFHEHRYADDMVGKVDVLYVTRFQWERIPDEGNRVRLMEDCRRNQITYSMANRMMNGSIIMHPLPINTEKSDGYPEIASDVDYHPRQRYFKQSNNGQYVRMALLDILLRPEMSRDICKLIQDVPPGGY